MVSFSRLHDIGTDDFVAAMEIYSESFPLPERHPVDIIQRRVSSGQSQLYVGRGEHGVVFIALLWPLAGTGFILLDYMATRSEHRQRGIASSFLEVMHSVLDDSGATFVIEVENPQYGANREERQRRVALYRKHGGKELSGVRYLLPPLQGHSPTEMVLMILPATGAMSLPATVARDLVTQIYRELYERGPDDEFVQACLGTVADDVRLI
jgi:hypothetical protein